MISSPIKNGISSSTTSVCTLLLLPSMGRTSLIFPNNLVGQEPNECVFREWIAIKEITCALQYAFVCFRQTKNEGHQRPYMHYRTSVDSRTHRIVSSTV